MKANTPLLPCRPFVTGFVIVIVVVLLSAKNVLQLYLYFYLYLFKTERSISYKPKPLPSIPDNVGTRGAGRARAKNSIHAHRKVRVHADHYVS